jgi:hypothetical protein
MPIILYDTDIQAYIQGDAVLDYIRGNAVGGQQMNIAVQDFVNGNKNFDSYLQRKVFNKQKLDLSLRKINFKLNDARGDESGKTLFLTVLYEKIKKETSGTGMPVSQARLITQINEPNFYNNYRLASKKTGNTCPFLAK